MLKMKKSNILLGVFSALLLASCGKDIEVEKNLTTDWAVDEEVINSDIRTFVGYDPRYDWAMLEKKVEEIPMITFSTLNIVEQNEREIKVNLLKPLTQSAEVVLEYNPSAFEKVKAEYDGFELGDANLVQVVEGEKTLAAGDQATKFKIAITNQPGFTRKVIVPFSVKVRQGDLKLVENHQDLLVKIVPEVVKLEYSVNPREFTGGIYYGEPILLNSNGAITVKLSRPVPTNFTIGLERDDTLLPSGQVLAQAGIEGTSLASATFQNVTERQLRLSLQTLDPATTHGKYALPLKLVITDENGQTHAVPNGEIIVQINIMVRENLTFTEDDMIDYRWRSIPKNTITATNPNRAFNNIEGDQNDYVYLRTSQNFRMNFDQQRTVKGLLVRSLSGIYGTNYRMKEFSIYAVQGGVENYEGKFSVQQKENDLYLIKFTEPLEDIDSIILKDIKANNDNTTYLISEIDVYE